MLAEPVISKPDFNFLDLKTKSIDGKRHYLTPSGEKLISITTLLSHFKKNSIAEWRKKVGDAEADRITREASTGGTKFHSAAELYLDGKDHTKFVQTEEEKSQFDCLKTHLDNYLDATWWQEIPLYSKRLGVAGRVDLIGVHKGKPTIIDFKTSRKWKKKDWIHDYFMQATFYAMAFYEMTGYPIKDLCILISVNKGEDLQVFEEKVGDWMKPLKYKIDEYKSLMED